MKKNQIPAASLTLTIGIPTCYGQDGIIRTIESIRSSRQVDSFRFIIEADSVPFSAQARQDIRHMDVELHEHKNQGTQLQKIKTILSRTTSDIIVLTQDDVMFHPDALRQIYDAFSQQPNLTMVSAHIQPLPAHTFIEHATAAGTEIVNSLGPSWRNGDNYLMANGRCLAFRTGFLKTFRIPERLVNSDAFFYFENKRRGGTFRYLPDAVVYNRNPQTYQEFLRQRQRFAYSKNEIAPYFSSDIDQEYRIPTLQLVDTFFKEFVVHPLRTTGYISLLARAAAEHLDDEAKSPLWKMNTSTKG